MGIPQPRNFEMSTQSRLINSISTVLVLVFGFLLLAGLVWMIIR